MEGALAGHLRRNGARTRAEMVGNLGWFWTRLSEGEITRLLEAARRDELIVPLGHELDADEAKIEETEWNLTAKGQALDRIRTLSLRDLFVTLRSSSDAVVSGTEKWSKLGLSALGFLGPIAAVGAGVVAPLVGGIAFWAVALVAIRTGLRGRAALKSTAERWTRLRHCRPQVHAWHAAETRLWHLHTIWVAAALFLATLAAWVGTNVVDYPLEASVLVGLFVATLLAAGLRCFLRTRQEAREFRAEREKVYRLRKSRLAAERACGYGHRCPVALGRRRTCPLFQPTSPRAKAHRDREG